MKNIRLLLIINAVLGMSLIQGFQCAAPELASARTHVKSRDWHKARESLDRLLAREPTNLDGLILRGDVCLQLADLGCMTQSYGAARKHPAIKKQQLEAISLNLYNAWVGAYNATIEAYEAAMRSDDDATRKKPLDLIQAALTLKPEYSDPLILRGNIYDYLSDTNSALRAYNDWWEIEKSGFEFIQKHKLHIGVDRTAILTAFGKPAQSNFDSTADGTMVADLIHSDGKAVYLFSLLTADAGSVPRLIGWSYDPPTTLSERELWRTRHINISPLKQLAIYHFLRNETAQSLSITSIVSRVDPKDRDMGQLRGRLLQMSGKTDEAISELKEVLKNDPKNTFARNQYADLLAQVKRNDEAIAEYQQVLRDEPENDIALYNLGAAHKNRASIALLAELEKEDADRNYKRSDSFLEDLRIASGYFEQLRKQFKYADDLALLDQLANIYEVRKEKSKLKLIIMELEALESKHKSNPHYYSILEGLYARNQLMDKLKALEKKRAQ